MILCIQLVVVVAAEAPEEAVETRSLYDQLQAQKEAKQLDYEEQHRLSVYLSFHLLPLKCRLLEFFSSLFLLICCVLDEEVVCYYITLH